MYNENNDKCHKWKCWNQKKNEYWFAFSENKIEAVYLVRYCLLRYVNEAIITN